MAELEPIGVCADDYALSPGVTAGIVEAATAGRISATSAMTTRPGWPEAARAIAPLSGRVEVGLHLNLTLGAPLTGETPLAPDGRLPGARTLLLAALGERLPLAAVQAEVAAQLDAFAAAMGRPPDFVDGHWHVQTLPGVRTALIAELTARGLAGQLWLRDSGDSLGHIAARGRQRGKAAFVAWMGRGFRAEAEAAGFATNRGFSGFSDFAATGDYGAEFMSFLTARGSRHLVMCHPGRVDAELAGLDDATVSRERELAFLISDAFPALLRARGLQLAPLGGAASAARSAG